MPGPWEKYQHAAAPPAGDGPWAKYAKAAQPKTEPAGTVHAPVDPTEGMSTTDKVLAGVGKFMSDRARGLHQLGNTLLDPYGIQAAINPAVAAQNEQLRQAQTEADQRDAPLMDTGAGKAGYMGSQLAELLLPVGMLRGTKAMSAVLPTTVRGNAIQGVVQGLAAPTGEGDSRAANATLGGGINTLTAGLFKGVGAARGAIKNASRPGLSSLDRSAAGVLTREADNPANLTRAAPSQVPGVQRDLAEETLDPGIARLSRNLRGTNKQFDALDRSNNAARVNALEKIAGSDADMSAALDARNNTTNSLRDAAFQEGEEFDAASAAQQTADRGSHAAKVRDIEKANERRRALGYSTQLPIPDAPASSSPKQALQSRIGEVIAKNNGNPAVQTALAVVGGALRQADDSVPGLYNVRKYVGDLLSGRAGGDTVSAKAASRELIDIRDAIDDELQRRAPSFSKYLTAYQDASRPINRMDVGRDLTDRSSGSAVLDPVTGHQVLTPAQFSKKARDLDAVAARATGFAKAKATDILSATDIATIKAIQDDLERQAFRATAGSGGNSHTFERQALQDRLAKGAGRQVLSRIPVVGRHASDFLGMLETSRNDRMKERLAYLVANPAEARRVLSALPPTGQKIVSDALTQLGGSVGRAAAALATMPGSRQ